MARRMIDRLLELLGWRRWTVTARYADLDDVPDRLGSRDIALITAPERTKWIIFDCPCRRGHRIMLNADRSRKPFWTLHASEPATINPSIDFRGGRRCHYSIRNGRTIWAGDSD